jgi:hypothetical protein
VCGSVEASPTIISEKKMPIDSTIAGVLERRPHAGARAALVGPARCS